MPTITVDFDVFKALTLRRPSEDISENDVLRELLGLPRKAPRDMKIWPVAGDWLSKGVRFPAGTEFRATYKGKNYLAHRIRAIALEHQVPIVENQALAQALYKSADVGQEIPAHLYRAVAEILAYIFKLMNQRRS